MQLQWKKSKAGSARALLHKLPHHVVEDAPMCIVYQLKIRVEPEKMLEMSLSGIKVLKKVHFLLKVLVSFVP